MKKITKTFIILSALFPLITYAQLVNTYSLIFTIGKIVSRLSLVVAGMALLVFFWGLVKFIFRVGGDEKAVSEGKNLIVWGLIAIFAMVSVWGIIEFVSKDIGFTHTFGLPLLPVR